jgi:proline iminopeptidase
VATFTSYDGTGLAYHESGSGDPLVCLPGGPLLPTSYFAELGGLAAARRLVMLDHRGTGASDEPRDPETFRIDRMVADVEALREHLGLERLDILAHSAGANLTMLYAAAHPERVGRIAFITPGLRAVGVPPSTEALRAELLTRSGEDWFPAAWEAFERIEAGEDTEEQWNLVKPVYYGTWNAAAQAHGSLIDETDFRKQAMHYAEGVFDPEGTRAALADLAIPVLILAGARDFTPTPQIAAEFAGCFPRATVRLAVQPGAGHFPWAEDSGAFGALVSGWLTAG